MAKKIKVEVLKPYRNKYTKSLHQAGDFLEVSEKRFEEVNGAGYGELLRKVDDEEEGD